ncbi:helix-turn-helix domain-containing protein [Conexibacter sp. SYSU D00693]|uniref:winged helix-turn-helix transcriptional regulator n=1 Tax=Conexibacter sp. SYSU D00693 TaxID=2812560 RepID=UPI00196B6F3D|nr:helix-turn-helix domain-containing protein [Conexibacter sp. SYSU D00693]
MPFRAYDQHCSIAAALEVLGERWTLLVMREVLLGRRRFADLKRRLGVAPNILSDRLQTLVDHGLLIRERYADNHPDAFEYRPTRKGVDVQPVLLTLMAWGDAHATPPGGPPRVAVHRTCGHEAHPQLHCTHCGDALSPRDTQIGPGPGANAQQRAEPLLPASA